ncbi:hypothetical protein LI328DRAFT_92682 [Trichoderma asperelloides]|nr:hypothetical protein LI328DRAFT_92682 [Trichoderma asperelloides]
MSRSGLCLRQLIVVLVGSYSCRAVQVLQQERRKERCCKGRAGTRQEKVQDRYRRWSVSTNVRVAVVAVLVVEEPLLHTERAGLSRACRAFSATGQT